MKKVKLFLILFFGIYFSNAQINGITDTSKSPYARLQSVNLNAVHWTEGFWKDQLEVEKTSTLPYMWNLYHDAETTHAYRNFEIAAGVMKGKHDGPSFHDGDFYKILEGMAAAYASNPTQELADSMDNAISLIKKAQRADGYLHTPVLIEERWGTMGPEELQKQLGFEKYNMGHLMTAACIHYRATGKTNFLDIAKGVGDYLYDFYKTASPELARNAICPSHYMGVIEMYRTTRDPRYLELAKNLIDIRGKTTDGTDDNQDRIPFRDQKKAMGHAVRANYLYAGVADLYAETGESILLERLNSIWDDVTQRKMYITGACGALYDGVSPDGTSYNPAEVQKIHQAYGRPYQLPNATAHTETCANIGNVLWNWRMLQLTGEAKYADIIELTLYNSILSGISLDGKDFLYNNPLAVYRDLPFEQRWGNERQGYIALSNCCAPNVTRTLAEVGDYAYNLAPEGLYINLYGSNIINTRTLENEEIEIEQLTNYPWDGKIKFQILKAPQKEFAFFLRIPGWSSNSKIKINNINVDKQFTSGSYEAIKQKWKRGDVITLEIPMPVKFMEANPLVEETKNQVAIKKGPLVYCVESESIQKGQSLKNLKIDLNSEFITSEATIKNRKIIALTAKGFFNSSNWESKLYQPLQDHNTSTSVTLIPYFSWGNRSKGDMAVWLSY